jgi:hypothetical protein
MLRLFVDYRHFFPSFHSATWETSSVPSFTWEFC